MATKKGGKVSGKGSQGGEVGQRAQKGGKVKGPKDHGSNVGKGKGRKSAKKR